MTDVEYGDGAVLVDRPVAQVARITFNLPDRRNAKNAAARFKVAFIKVGLSACDIGTSWLLPRLIGASRAYEVMWSQLEIGTMQAGIDLENRTQILSSFAGDMEEAMAAFLEKRPPHFSD